MWVLLSWHPRTIDFKDIQNEETSITGKVGYEIQQGSPSFYFGIRKCEGNLCYSYFSPLWYTGCEAQP
jgi:hypothetical protein